MIKLDDVTKRGGSRSGKNSLFNVINHQPDIDKKFIYFLKIHMKQNINF